MFHALMSLRHACTSANAHCQNSSEEHPQCCRFGDGGICPGTDPEWLPKLDFQTLKSAWSILSALAPVLSPLARRSVVEPSVSRQMV